MTTAYLIKFFTVMISMMLADVCWTKYFMKVADKNALHASFWGSIIILFGAVSTTSYVEDHTLILPAVLGAFIGTYITIKYKSKQDEVEKTDNKVTAL
jgi:hypothetical protein